jgi:aryl-alcohol dehydrogenase
VQIEEPRAGEILVRIVATGICHTDLKVLERPGPRPIVLGHEGAGVVERVGPGVTVPRAGDHVILTHGFCGACPRCVRGDSPYCDESDERNFGGARMDGSTPLSQDGTPILGRFFSQSSFARHAIADARSAIVVPEDVPLELAGPLACGLPTGAGAVLGPLAVGPTRAVAVFGVGAVGLGAVMAARVAGARRIVAVDVRPDRLALATELGATDVVDAREDDVAAAIVACTGGGADATLDSSGSPRAFEQAVRALAPGGTAGYVAIPPSSPAPDLGHLMAGGRSIRGIVQGGMPATVIVPLLVDLLRRGLLPVERLVATYPFARIDEAWADAETGRVIKPVLVMAH